MIEAIKFWNEPNNQSHWDFHIDPGWAQYGEMTRRAARAVGRVAPGVTRCSPPYWSETIRRPLGSTHMATQEPWVSAGTV